MAKKKDNGVAEKVAPTLEKQWKVAVPFYDLKQQKEVKIGDIVEHTELREKLNLIE